MPRWCSACCAPPGTPRSWPDLHLVVEGERKLVGGHLDVLRRLGAGTGEGIGGVERRVLHVVQVGQGGQRPVHVAERDRPPERPARSGRPAVAWVQPPVQGRARSRTATVTPR